MTTNDGIRQPDIIEEVLARHDVQAALGRTMVLPDGDLLTVRLEAVEAEADFAGESVRLATVADRAITIVDESDLNDKPTILFRPRLNTMSPAMSVVQILVLRNVLDYDEPLPVPELTRLAGFELATNDRINTQAKLRSVSRGASALLQETIVRDYSTFAIHPLVAFQPAANMPPIQLELNRTNN